MTVSRRAFLAGLLATAACSGSNGGDGGLTRGTDGPAATDPPLPTVPPVEPAPVDLASDPFTLGVASGDPDDRTVVLWTRLAPDPMSAVAGLPGGDVEVAWDIADDEAFARIVGSGLALAESAFAHSVHVTTPELRAGTSYWYRFRVGGFTSTVGRTRTAPAADDATPARLALASCQRYDDGYYAAHRDIAAADVDFVVFVGDYIYETAAAPQPVRALPGSGVAAADLDAYRERYAAGRLDPDLAACHARHPWFVVWDDHEVVDNYAGAASDGAQRARRAEGYQAWYEHMPVRLPPPSGPDYDIYRTARWGSTLELLLLDGRQHRSLQGCGRTLESAACADLVDPARTMLGEAQEVWLSERFASASTRWVALAQQVVFAPMEAVGQANLDAWDGYPQARDRLVDALVASPVRNAVVLTGAIHAELVANVPQGTQTVATELVTSSISTQFSSAIGDAFDLLPFAAVNARHAYSGQRGWLRCEVTPDRWLATYRRVVDVADPASAVEDGPSFEVLDGRPGANEVD